MQLYKLQTMADNIHVVLHRYDLQSCLLGHIVKSI